jgi:hypothetical protein
MTLAGTLALTAVITLSGGDDSAPPSMVPGCVKTIPFLELNAVENDEGLVPLFKMIDLCVEFGIICRPAGGDYAGPLTCAGMFAAVPV